MALSTRLAAATSFTDELREECARLLGWTATGREGMNTRREMVWLCARDNQTAYGLPKLDLYEIVAEARKRGLALSVQNSLAHEAYWFGFRCHKRHKTFSAKHMDAQLCAMTALAMAIEGEN